MPPRQYSNTGSYHHLPCGEKLLIPPKQFKNVFSPAEKRAGNYE